VLHDDGSAMKQDAEVLLMLRERAKGRTQKQAAARAGMSVRTARSYERHAKLPSQLKQPRTHRSRPNPLVRKPGAFAHYRYRDDLFPSLVFRRAYDALQSQTPERADRHYVRVLHLAAGTSEIEVEASLSLLLDQHVTPTFDAVRDLVRAPAEQRVPELGAPVFDFDPYDRLLGKQATAHG